MTPLEFPRLFLAAFSAQDADLMASFLTDDATVMTLTGVWTEGRPAAKAAMAAEFAGVFAKARLVTGRFGLRDVSPGVTVLHQRFVVSGARRADGQGLPRFAAMLSAVLVAGSGGWQVAHLGFSALAE